MAECCTLNSQVRLVLLQFNFNNPSVIPLLLHDRPQEQPAERKARKARATGTVAIEPSENVSLGTIATDLLASGYELVEAFYQKRIDQRDPKKLYHTVRFTFARREYAKSSPDFLKIRDDLLLELGKMANEALWRMRVFLNPYFVNGEEVPGEYALSVNLEHRQPFVDYSGKLIAPPPSIRHLCKIRESKLEVVPNA